jgi:NADH:ubiquinone oxidoreductase subunit E
MAKKENKTQSTEKSVVEFLNKVEPEQKRKDSFALLEMMQQQTGFEAKMWGDSMIGFGVSL